MAPTNDRGAPRRAPWLLEPHPAAQGPDLAQRLARARLALLKRRESRWPWLPLCLLLATALTVGGHTPRALAEDAGARGGLSDFDDVGAGSLFLDGTDATRLATDVEIQVNGLVARVSVRQSFENPGADWVEGVYVFPLPELAAVDRLRMQVGQRVIDVEILERKVAQTVYAQARDSGQLASLVEQERPNLFTTSVANIGPGETVTIEIGYLDTLAFDAGKFSLRFPMTITPRYMPGDSLAQAKAALKMALARLRPGDRFNVVQFNTSTESLYLAPQPVTGNTRADAVRYVRALEADGGTEMLPALELALEGVAPSTHLRQIVFITDGSVGNEEELFTLIHARLENARLFTVSIGSAPNTYFMRKAARFGRGTFTLIGSQAGVGDEMQALFFKLESPVLIDLEIDWPGPASPEVWPARSRDLYAGEPMVVTARLTGEDGIIALSGKVLGGHWLRQHELESGREHSGIAALWARGKIESLMDQRIAGGDPDEIRAQVVETALRHRLVSRYTSLVAIDRTPARPAGVGLAQRTVPGVAPQGTHGEILSGFPQTATPAALHFLVSAICLFCAVLLAGSSRGRTNTSDPAASGEKRRRNSVVRSCLRHLSQA